MKLTKEELDELDVLQRKKADYKRPMMEEEFKRREYLINKQFHNKCTNPYCTGYEGTDNEMYCPKCKQELYKLDSGN